MARWRTVLHEVIFEVEAPARKGRSVILRFYGPLKPWFDQTWGPGEIELVKSNAE